jgi:hypothetical protein
VQTENKEIGKRLETARNQPESEYILLEIKKRIILGSRCCNHFEIGGSISQEYQAISVGDAEPSDRVRFELLRELPN